MYDGPDETTPTNNAPLRAGKGVNYEGGVRVPMIVRAPGVTKAGTESDVVVSSVDHFISIMELLNVPFPKDHLTDGYSYIPALEGKTYERPAMYSTFCHYTPDKGGRPNISMRQGPWRLYKFYFDGPNREHRMELYNLDEDIGETNNLAEAMPERVAEMVAQLDAHAEEAEILLPRLNVNYAGNVADVWAGSEDTEIFVAEKILRIKSTGTQPSVETNSTPNVSDATFALTFEMKSSGKGDGLMSWKVSGNKEYLEENTTPFESMHDGEWHSYKVDMPLKGRLSHIRIQPSGSPGDIEIKNIVLVNADGYYIRDWPMY
jgi:hypothetical protein